MLQALDSERRCRRAAVAVPAEAALAEEEVAAEGAVAEAVFDPLAEHPVPSPEVSVIFLQTSGTKDSEMPLLNGA